MLPGSPRIALQIEKNRAHGRALLKGVADYALEHTDWRLELVDPEKLTSPAYLAAFDGFIVRVMDERTADALLKSRKPVVDTYGRVDDNPLVSIRLDDRAIAEMAFSCFEERHCRSLACCGFDGLRFSDLRGEAFRACAAAKGRPCAVFAAPRRARIADTFFRDEKTDVPDAAALGKWLKSLPKPVGIFCCNDLRAVQVLKTCADVGLDVPSEVAVLGVDNDVLLCTFAKPSLSSIETDPFALGRTAAALLDRQLKGGARRRTARPKAKKVVLHPPVRVVERVSTNQYPFRTPWLAEALRFIARNLTQEVSADDVVRHIGYSHPTVAKAFVEELGHPIKREILVQRLRLACSLLRQTDLPSGTIALRCGYRSPQYFSHCFVREFKRTPDAWRRREF